MPKGDQYLTSVPLVIVHHVSEYYLLDVACRHRGDTIQVRLTCGSGRLVWCAFAAEPGPPTQSKSEEKRIRCLTQYVRGCTAAVNEKFHKVFFL